MTAKDAGTNINIRRQGIPSGRKIHLTRVTRLRALQGTAGQGVYIHPAIFTVGYPLTRIHPHDPEQSWKT